jgi:hypothetical protein
VDCGRQPADPILDEFQRMLEGFIGANRYRVGY